jgi:hypothetical protein
MRICRLVSVCIFMGAWLATAGCYRLSGKATTIPPPEPTTAVTDEEAQAAATALEEAVRSGDRSQAMQEFSLEVVAHRVATGLPINPQQMPELLKVVPAKVDTIEMVDLILTSVKKGFGFRLIHVRPAEGRHVARFRIGQGDSRIHYFDVILARFPTGRTGVEDLVHLNDGERLTDTVRREILPAATLRDPELEAHLSEEDRLYLAHKTEIADLKRALGNHKWKDSKDLFDGLPAELRDLKPIRFAYARALVHSGAGSATESKALTACRELFPNDPATDLLAMEFHWRHKEYKAATQDAAALRNSIGDDAAIDAMEAAALVLTLQIKEATAAADRAVKSDPEFEAGYRIRILIAMGTGDHAMALDLMKRGVERAGMRFEDLKTNPIYANFVKSPEYQMWLIWTANRPGT